MDATKKTTTLSSGVQNSTIDLMALLKTAPNITISVNLSDLFEFGEELVRNSKKQLEQIITDVNTETYPSPDQTSKILSVDKSTLWRWAKQGYLVPIEIGRKRRYRMSDIRKILGA